MIMVTTICLIVLDLLCAANGRYPLALVKNLFSEQNLSFVLAMITIRLYVYLGNVSWKFKRKNYICKHDCHQIYLQELSPKIRHLVDHIVYTTMNCHVCLLHFSSRWICIGRWSKMGTPKLTGMFCELVLVMRELVSE